MQETRPSVTDTMTVTATATPEHIIPETSATPGSMTVTEPPVTVTEPPGEVTTRPSPPRTRGEMRQGILTLLRAYPEGLRAEEMRVHLQVDKYIGDILAGHGATARPREAGQRESGVLPRRRRPGYGHQGAAPADASGQAAPPGPAPALPEAPARVQVLLELCSRQGYWTLRDTDEIRLLARLEAVLTRVPGTATSHG